MQKKIIKPGGEIEDAKLIRTLVFVEEQGFSIEDEYDDIDAVAHHIVYYEQQKPIATCRFFPDPEKKNTYHLGRLAVLKSYRKTGIGKIMLADMQAEAEKLGAKSLYLGAQIPAVGFYRKSGFEVCGEQFLDAGSPHLPMSKNIA